MKYVVNEIEGEIAKLEDVDTKKIKNVNVKDMPSIMEGDVLCYYDGIYVIDTTDKMERKTELRHRLNTLIDNGIELDDDYSEYL